MMTRRFTKQVQGLNHINFEFLRSRRREKSAPAYSTWGLPRAAALARERTSIEVVSMTGGDGDGIFEEGDG
jgi:hypothetical protein